MLVPSLERRKFLELARKRYQESLTPESDAGRYLTETRRLSWGNVAYFRLGVVEDPLPGHEDFRGMLAIPYLAPNGDTLTLRFRRLSGEGPKYRSMPGDTPRPFNTAALERHTLDFWLTEGEIDAMTLHQLGLPANGIPGANCWKPEWRYIYEQYRTVYVPHDGDDAGRKFAATVTEQLNNARPIDMGTDEEGVPHDVNSYFILHGPENTLKKVGYVARSA